MQKRLFVALDLPESIRDGLQRLCHGLPRARWLAPEQLHLTLSFIGEVDGAVFADIREVLAEITAAPFELQLDGLGFFPPRGKPRVLWAGLAASTPLLGLQQRIQGRLLELGLDLETRKYAPHITLARIQQTPVSRLSRYLESHGRFCSPPFSVDRFQLYSSVLSSKGAVHWLEQEYLLTGA
ncbi:RNA 2',3'-cyclic phosphodiesterase [Desulfogranum mediterraneum]|uniref:RNA 2',3'-cyclic phosphodiesterase n=1 Tax=Desulfogranum mediterraneum TaxID=160661 RepID=UPI0004220545|nr:RNA 2',3'-cyclic phosphodiesterase [Desulfogranum mediterraneum]